MLSLQTYFTSFFWLISSFSRVFVTSRQLLPTSVDLHYKGGSVKCLHQNYYGWAFNLFVGVVSLLFNTLCLLDADILNSTRDVLINVSLNISKLFFMLTLAIQHGSMSNQAKFNPNEHLFTVSDFLFNYDTINIEGFLDIRRKNLEKRLMRKIIK